MPSKISLRPKILKKDGLIHGRNDVSKMKKKERYIKYVFFFSSSRLQHTTKLRQLEPKNTEQTCKEKKKEIY